MIDFDSPKIQDEDVCLKISRFDLSRGARHFYGKLHPADSNKGKPITLTRELTLRDASALNKLHGCLDTDMGAYKPGEQYEGFDHEKDVVTEALKQWRVHFPDTTRLVIADPAHEEHKGIVATAEEVRFHYENFGELK